MRRFVSSALFLLFLSSGIAAVVPEQTADDSVRAGRAERVTLTPEEQSWIDAHPVIRAGHDSTYLPYAFQDAAGEIVGIDPDYLELIGRRTGLHFKNEVRRDWGVVIQDFKGGRLDVLPSLARLTERESYLTYTRTYASALNVVVTRYDSPSVFSLGELKGRPVGVLRGAYDLRRDLAQRLPGSEVVEYATSAECYQAVSDGKIFAAIGEVAGASYLIRIHGWANLRVGSVVSTSTELAMGVRHDWSTLEAIINKAIDSISTEDRERINSRWIAVAPSVSHRWGRYLKIGGIGAAVISAIFLLVLFHNRRLARELAIRRRVQVELERAHNHLVRAGHEKSELMHMVAHDLRGPLTAIQIGLDLLQRVPPLNPATRLTTTARINESVDRMARLINDLLSAQNVAEGRYALSFVAGDALYLARSAVTALTTVAQHKCIEIETRLPATPVPLTTDFVALQQVVDNLLSNALKYSPVGSRVEIAVEAKNNHCRIEVRDQGPGVLPDERDKIFEKFGRGSARPTQGEESIGLGLWIVRRFAVALHGQVWCESGPGGIGSAFIVEVPLLPPLALTES